MITLSEHLAEVQYLFDKLDSEIDTMLAICSQQVREGKANRIVVEHHVDIAMAIRGTLLAAKIMLSNIGEEI